MKNSFFYTLREDVKNEDVTSGNLLARAGMVRKNSAGVYMYMPLGLKVLRNIERIVREEMDNTGASELLMPTLIPEETYVETGRSEAFGPDMFRLNDRFGKPYVLGPTHEELFTIAAKMKVKSYKDLPFNIYQFQNKFRDEPRPRYGLIRVREFIMKDAYSFDTDLDGLEVSYQKMFNAYKNVFDRMDINYRIVKSDTGAMGGLLSEEFQAITEIGEDVVIYCDSCDFSSNIDIAPCVDNKIEDNSEMLELEKIHTPSCKTIADLAKSLNVAESKLVKTMIYKVDGELIAFLIRGDLEANETKIAKLFKASTVELPEAEEIESMSKAVIGFAGPINLDIKVVADASIVGMKNMIVGANEVDYHYKNANIKRDFDFELEADVVNITENNVCPTCGAKLNFTKGIEVGNTFKLGSKYSEALGLQYMDQEQKLHPVQMGSYGIGLGRSMAAIVEQHHDEKGIIWPKEVAPYNTIIVLINEKDEDQARVANELYENLKENGIDVLLDDRKERAGVKFNDADLIGIPNRITVGRTASEGIIEFKKRTSSEVTSVKVEEILKQYNVNNS